MKHTQNYLTSLCIRLLYYKSFFGYFWFWLALAQNCFLTGSSAFSTALRQQERLKIPTASKNHVRSKHTQGCRSCDGMWNCCVHIASAEISFGYLITLHDSSNIVNLLILARCSWSIAQWAWNFIWNSCKQAPDPLLGHCATFLNRILITNQPTITKYSIIHYAPQQEPRPLEPNPRSFLSHRSHNGLAKAQTAVLENHTLAQPAEAACYIPPFRTSSP